MISVLQRTRLAVALAVLLTGLPNGALAQSRDAALRAMQQMRFAVAAGDRAEIVFKIPADGSTFTVVAAYTIAQAVQPPGIAEPTGYVIDLSVKSAGPEGMPKPPGFDRLMQAMYPPVQIRTDKDLEVLEVMNWADVERRRKQIEERLTSTDPKAALILSLMTAMVSQKEQLMGLFAPIGEMQRRLWQPRGNAFDLTVTRHHGLSVGGASDQSAPMQGQRRLTPIEVKDGKLRTTFRTTYDGTSLTAALKASPLGALLSSGNATFSFQVTSTGEADYDLATGWVERLSETITVVLQHPSARPAPRTERYEIIHRRITGR